MSLAFESLLRRYSFPAFNSCEEIAAQKQEQYRRNINT